MSQSFMQSPGCALPCKECKQNMDDTLCVQVSQAQATRLQVENSSSLRLMSNFYTVVTAIEASTNTP